MTGAASLIVAAAPITLYWPSPLMYQVLQVKQDPKKGRYENQFKDLRKDNFTYKNILLAPARKDLPGRNEELSDFQ